jgi:phospholipid/cholesterol/gamma-HCH transport system substrate-binding protein
MSAAPLNQSVPLRGEYDTGISEVFGMMGDIIVEVRALIASLDGTFGETGQSEKIRRLISDLQKLTANANSFFETNRQAMQKTVDDMSAAAGSMRVFLDSNKVEIDQTITNLAELSSTMKDLSGRMDDLVLKIAEGEGTLGKAVTDDSLYIDLRKTVNNLDSLINDFKENPRRYVKVSVF